jgi:hypothetical protein
MAFPHRWTCRLAWSVDDGLVTGPVNDLANDRVNDRANDRANDRVKGSATVTESLNESFRGMVRVPGCVDSWLDRLESGQLACIVFQPTTLDGSCLRRGLRSLCAFQVPQAGPGVSLCMEASWLWRFISLA